MLPSLASSLLLYRGPRCCQGGSYTHSPLISLGLSSDMVLTCCGMWPQPVVVSAMQDTTALRRRLPIRGLVEARPAAVCCASQGFSPAWCLAGKDNQREDDGFGACLEGRCSLRLLLFVPWLWVFLCWQTPSLQCSPTAGRTQTGGTGDLPMARYALASFAAMV